MQNPSFLMQNPSFSPQFRKFFNRKIKETRSRIHIFIAFSIKIPGIATGNTHPCRQISAQVLPALLLSLGRSRVDEIDPLSNHVLHVALDEVRVVLSKHKTQSKAGGNNSKINGKSAENQSKINRKSIENQ